MDYKKISDKIIEYLKKNNIFNITALENVLGMPIHTIAKAMQGVRYIPKKYIKDTINLLSKHGFEND